MDDNTFSPLAQASTMQRRTRREKHFEEIESTLPSPQEPPEAAQARRRWSVSGLLSRLGKHNPFSRPATKDNIVWLFDNMAFQSAPGAPWRAEFNAAVFEREDKDTLIDVVTGIARVTGLTDDAEERRTVEERVLPFLWDLCPARTIPALHQGQVLRLGPTDVNGLSSNLLPIPNGTNGSVVRTSAKVGGGGGAMPHMQTYYAGPDGWGIISGAFLPCSPSHPTAWHKGGIELTTT